MLNYVIRRLLMVPLMLFGVTVLIFGMLQLLSPVERSALYVRDMPKNERALEGVIKQYGWTNRYMCSTGNGWWAPATRPRVRSREASLRAISATPAQLQSRWRTC